MNTDIDTIYLGGEWVTPSTTNKIEIQSPATGEPVGSVIAAGKRDAKRVSPARGSSLPAGAMKRSSTSSRPWRNR